MHAGVVDQIDELTAAGDQAVLFPEYGNEAFGKVNPFFEYMLPVGLQLLVVNVQCSTVNSVVYRKILLQRIALRYRLVVGHQGVEVFGIRLGNYPVHELSAGFAPLNDQITVCG